MATERSLLTAGAKLFSQKGYENTRTLEIAKEAGVNESLITRYFGGKEGLLLAVLKDEVTSRSLVESEESRTAAAEFPLAEEGLGLRDALEFFFEAGKKHVREKEEFMRIGHSRILVDPKMAALVQERLVESSVRQVNLALRGYLTRHSLSNEEQEAIALLVAATSHSFNFWCRRVHKMEEGRTRLALSILAQSIESFLAGRALKGTRSVTTNA